MQSREFMELISGLVCARLCVCAIVSCTSPPTTRNSHREHVSVACGIVGTHLRTPCLTMFGQSFMIVAATPNIYLNQQLDLEMLVVVI